MFGLDILLSAVMISLFALLIPMMFVMFFAEYRYLKTLGIRAEGTLIKFERNYPVYEFVYLEKTYTFRLNFGSRPQLGKAGDKVTILVNPEEPEKSLPDDPGRIWDNLLGWLATFTIFGLAILFSG